MKRTALTSLFALFLVAGCGRAGFQSARWLSNVVGTSWHMSKGLKVPEGIHLLPLPAYSPELQPAEKLWPLMHESVANKDITDMDTLEEQLVERCRELRAQPEVISSHTLFAWWAHAARAEWAAAA